MDRIVGERQGTGGRAPPGRRTSACSTPRRLRLPASRRPWHNLKAAGQECCGAAVIQKCETETLRILLLSRLARIFSSRGAASATVPFSIFVPAPSRRHNVSQLAFVAVPASQAPPGRAPGLGQSSLSWFEPLAQAQPEAKSAGGQRPCPTVVQHRRSGLA